MPDIQDEFPDLPEYLEIIEDIFNNGHDAIERYCAFIQRKLNEYEVEISKQETGDIVDVACAFLIAVRESEAAKQKFGKGTEAYNIYADTMAEMQDDISRMVNAASASATKLLNNTIHQGKNT